MVESCLHCEAVRRALSDRLQYVTMQSTPIRDEAGLLAFLEDEIWPQIPPELLGTTLSKEEEEAILGFGEDGV